jgi:hypothetical protein
MTTYQDRIMDAITAAGCAERADTQTAAIVEAFMRFDRAGLDGLGGEEFAREAATIAIGFSADSIAIAAQVCELPSPPWATCAKRGR